MPTDATATLADLKVALVHHWLVTMRGAEKVLEEFCRIFPRADIYTFTADVNHLSDVLRARRIHTSFVQRWPRSRKFYRLYLPAMPLAFEQFDFGGYDLVLSSDSSLAKSIVAPAETPHVCYCYSPPRYLWNMYHEYLRDECRNPLKRLLVRVASHYLRQVDFSAAQRVDHFLCDSRTVQARIARYYRREATVVHPPVALDQFQPVAGPGDYYLAVSALNAYKRVDLAVAACKRLGRRLVVVGEGPERTRLEAMAGPTVEFRGFVSAADLPALYAHCRALLFPGEEDFGITPLEAMASGRPIVAYRKGGATETVIHGETGLFFDEPNADALADALRRFEAVESSFMPNRLRAHAETFSPDRFRRECAAAIAAFLSGPNAGGG